MAEECNPYVVISVGESTEKIVLKAYNSFEEMRAAFKAAVLKLATPALEGAPVEMSLVRKCDSCGPEATQVLGRAELSADIITGMLSKRRHDQRRRDRLRCRTDR
jgi:hypothetical protein